MSGIYVLLLRIIIVVSISILLNGCTSNTHKSVHLYEPTDHKTEDLEIVRYKTINEYIRQEVLEPKSPPKLLKSPNPLTESWAIALLKDALIPANNLTDGFRGDLKLQVLITEGKMRVLEDFAFVEKGKFQLANGDFVNQRPWFAIKNLVTDGATIPAELWTLVGAPYTGRYLLAAVIHDQYCLNHLYSSDDTHLLFYKALLVAGMNPLKAKLFYYAVYVGGGSWDGPIIKNDQFYTSNASSPGRKVTREEIKLIKSKFEEDVIDIEDVPYLAKVLRDPPEDMEKIKERVAGVLSQKSNLRSNTPVSRGDILHFLTEENEIVSYVPFSKKKPGSWVWGGNPENKTPSLYIDENAYMPEGFAVEPFIEKVKPDYREEDSAFELFPDQT